MLEHLANDSHHFSSALAIIVLLVVVIGGLLIYRSGPNQRSTQGHYFSSLPISSNNQATKPGAPVANASDLSTAHDTVFILPDISSFTRFITANRSSSTRAQEVVFSLINAMIEACEGTLKLSKLEGDAVLFFCDTREHSAEKIGLSIRSIVKAFYETKQQFSENEPRIEGGCKNIDDLDLKIFVHRGKTTRFSFRGAIDHFGADLIILHRLMKNNVKGARYIMVTRAASEIVSLDANLESESVREELAEFGTIEATVFRIPNHLNSKTTIQSYNEV